MLNILLLQSNEKVAIELMNKINERSEKTKVCHIANSETETLKILEENNNIDAILLIEEDNAQMIETILQKIENLEKYKDSCVIISKDKEAEHIKIAKDNRAITAILEQEDKIEKLAENIIQIFKSKENINEHSELKNKIIKELLYLGYDISYKGTTYLTDSIVYIALNPDKYWDNLERDVYPIIAEKHNTSVHNVKSNITRANNSMYYDCEIQKLEDYFSFCKDTKPKIKTVINTTLNKIS